MHSYKIFDTQAEASSYAASLVVESAKSAIELRGVFRIVLTGGSSPLQLHHLLTEEKYKNKIDWSKTQIFWGDERFVNFESDLSNTKMAFETLIDALPIPPQNVYPMLQKDLEVSDTSVEEAAKKYEKTLIELAADDSTLSFDLLFLGVGSDGHTASWFPHTQVIHENDQWVSTSFNKEQDTERITLTPPIVLNAKKIVPLVFGKGKAKTLKEVVEGEYMPDEYPAQLLRNAKNDVIWILDKASSSLLDK